MNVTGTDMVVPRKRWKLTPGQSGRFGSVQFSRSAVSDSLRPHESQHARPPCPSPSPGVHSDSCASSQVSQRNLRDYPILDERVIWGSPES